MCFYWPKGSIFRHYCIENVQDRIQIRVYDTNNECVNHFSQFISVKVKKKLRKSQAQFQKKLRKLRLRQNDDYLIKKMCIHLYLLCLPKVLGTLIKC